MTLSRAARPSFRIGADLLGAATHAHPGLVAVAAGHSDAQGLREFSSGLLISPQLVLTSRHCVVADDGALRPDVTVRLAAGPHGEMQLSEELPGRVAWLGSGDIDAALVELTDSSQVLDGFAIRNLAWGEPVCTRAVGVTIAGMPRFAAEGTGNAAEIEVARGSLEPGSYAASGRYAVDLAAWPLQQSMMVEQLQTAENLLRAAAGQRDYFGRAQQPVAKNMPKYLLITMSNLNWG